MTPPRRRRSKAFRRVLIALVVLACLLVAADFGAAAYFEHEVSKRAQQQFELHDHPSVKVGGFSFLLQAVSGEYGLVTVDAKGIPVGTLRDVEVHADLRGVQAPLSDILSGALTGVPVREVVGQVKVKAADVTRAIAANENDVIRSLTDLKIEPVTEATVTTPPEEGAESTDESEVADKEGSTAGVKLCGTAGIAGKSTELCVFSIISLSENKIAVTSKRIELRNGGSTFRLPPSIQKRVLDFFSVDLDPGDLPFAVTPTSVRVEPGVLSVKGTAANLVLGH